MPIVLKTSDGEEVTKEVRIAAMGRTSDWLANAVQSGRVRWVLTSDAAGRGPGGDGRVGSSRVMTAVAAACKRVTVPTSSSTGTGGSTVSLYDCQGHASALRAAATN